MSKILAKTFNCQFRTCFPIMSICSLTLDIPVHIRDEETMLEVFERALKEDVGFGQC